MAKLTVQNLSGLAVNVKPPETVLRAVQATGTDWMHACGAKGRCTTCRMEILDGMENLSPESPAELKYREAGRLKAKERLACQCTVTGGEVLVRIPKPVQLPHQKYVG
jgi:ferredoxin, 2Fe-2S